MVTILRIRNTQTVGYCREARQRNPAKGTATPKRNREDKSQSQNKKEEVDKKGNAKAGEAAEPAAKRKKSNAATGGQAKGGQAKSSLNAASKEQDGGSRKPLARSRQIVESDTETEEDQWTDDQLAKLQVRFPCCQFCNLCPLNLFTSAV